MVALIGPGCTPLQDMMTSLLYQSNNLFDKNKNITTALRNSSSSENLNLARTFAASAIIILSIPDKAEGVGYLQRPEEGSEIESPAGMHLEKTFWEERNSMARETTAWTLLNLRHGREG